MTLADLLDPLPEALRGGEAERSDSGSGAGASSGGEDQSAGHIRQRRLLAIVQLLKCGMRLYLHGMMSLAMRMFRGRYLNLQRVYVSRFSLCISGFSRASSLHDVLQRHHRFVCRIYKVHQPQLEKRLAQLHSVELALGTDRYNPR